MDNAALPDATREPKKLFDLLTPGQWVSLFDGKTLAGWKREDAEKAGQKLSVMGGAILFDATAPGENPWLMWDGETPASRYEIAFESAAGPATEPNRLNFIVYFRNGAEMIGVGQWPRQLGFRWAGGEACLRELPQERGEWRRVQVRVTPGRVQVWVNGVRVVDAAPPQTQWSAEAFGFQTCSAAAAVRQIRMRRITLVMVNDLPLAPAKPYVAGPLLPPPKPETIELEPAPPWVQQGQPLRPFALVVQPAALDGVRTWTMETAAHRGPANALAFSPDGRLLASAGREAVIRIHDAASRKLLRVFSAIDPETVGLAWSPDGKYLASSSNTASLGRFVRLWDARSGCLVRSLGPAQPSQLAWGQPLVSMAWSPEVRMLACGGDKGTFVYDLAAPGGSGELAGLQVTKGRCNSLAWTPDGKLLIGSLHRVQLWNPASEVRSLVDFMADGTAAGIAGSPDGRMIATAWQWGDPDNGPTGIILRVRDVKTGAALLPASCPGHELLGTRWTPDGKKVVFCSGDCPPRLLAQYGTRGAVGVYDLSTQLTTRLCDADACSFACAADDATQSGLAWSPDDKTLAVSGQDSLRLVSVDRSAADRRLACPPGRDRRSLLAWSPDGKTIAAVYLGYNVTLWDVASDQERPIGAACSTVGPCWLDEGKTFGRDPPQHVRQIRPYVHAVPPGTLHQRVERRRRLAAPLASKE